MTIKEALQAVISESNQPYAVTYAKAALELGGSSKGIIACTRAKIEVKHEVTGDMMIGEELQVQILYVISNLSYWRGERAREVKAFLKNASKEVTK